MLINKKKIIIKYNCKKDNFVLNKIFYHLLKMIITGCRNENKWTKKQ